MARDLPEELELPLASGEPWWYFLGGRPSVDFVNTLRERWRRRVETIASPADLVRWLARVRLLDDDPAASAGEPLVGEARALREAIDEAFQAVLAGRSVPRRSVDAIDAWLEHAQRRPSLRAGREGLDLTETPATDRVRHALGLVALDAARILADPDARARLRVCASETCSARFFDRSPAGRRRWCSMRTCGNVAKARRFRAGHGGSPRSAGAVG